MTFSAFLPQLSVVVMISLSEKCFLLEAARKAFAIGIRRARSKGAESQVGELSDAIRLFLLNRGMLVTPFHVMMLTCPATTAAQVDGLLAGWAAAVEALRG